MKAIATFVAAGFCILCGSVSAQDIHRGDLFSSLHSSRPDMPTLGLSHAEQFSFAKSFSWIDRTSPEFLPPIPKNAPQQARRSTVTAATDSKTVDVRSSNLSDYVTGEVGFLYGRSTGKYGGEYKRGYIIGETGDDKFRISVGASYEDSTSRFQHLRH